MRRLCGAFIAMRSYRSLRNLEAKVTYGRSVTPIPPGLVSNARLFEGGRKEREKRKTEETNVNSLNKEKEAACLPACLPRSRLRWEDRSEVGRRSRKRRKL